MSDLKIVARRIEITDETESVDTDGYGGLLSDIAIRIDSFDGAGRAGCVDAVSNFQRRISHVVVGNQRKAVATDSDRRELTHVTRRVKGCHPCRRTGRGVAMGNL